MIYNINYLLLIFRLLWFERNNSNPNEAPNQPGPNPFIYIPRVPVLDPRYRRLKLLNFNQLNHTLYIQKISDSNGWGFYTLIKLKFTALNHSANSLFCAACTHKQVNSSVNRTLILFLSKIHSTVKLRNLYVKYEK